MLLARCQMLLARCYGILLAATGTAGQMANKRSAIHIVYHENHTSTMLGDKFNYRFQLISIRGALLFTGRVSRDELHEMGFMR